MIDKLRHTHPVEKLSQLVDVAKSGYQTWSRGIDGPNKIQTELAA